MSYRNWLALVGFVVLAEGAGAVGSVITAPEIAGWYATLIRPVLTPPDWVFAPVWTTLFVLMGVAAFLVYRRHARHAGVRTALLVYLLQLTLNVAWSAVFFGQHALGGALVAIAILWVAIAVTIAMFARISRAAAWLLVPYIAWVSFAAYLNYQLWMLN